MHSSQVSQHIFLYLVQLCLRIKASILLWWKYGNLSFMQYRNNISSLRGKKPHSFFFNLSIYNHLHDRCGNPKFPTGQIYIFSSSEAPDIYS